MPARTHDEIRPLLARSKFGEKPPAVRRLILEALEILSALGVPIETKKGRKAECMALALLAVADVRRTGGWSKAKDLSTPYALKSREIIKYVNEHFGERMSPGSYDDVRREHLLLPLAADIITRSLPAAARNDSRRGYALSPSAADVVRLYGRPRWKERARAFVAATGDLSEKLAARRALEMTPVKLPNDVVVKLTPGGHNDLQKAVVEQFLPRFGHGAEVLYLGDAAKKRLHLDEDALRALRFFDLDHGELPDVVAYSKSKNWIFLIEAVHSFGAITAPRRLTLSKLTKDCAAPIVFVTAFRDRATFRKFVADLAWEQEVWIADEPDHLAHFNGDKFLGPHSR
jgi:hypothetical protein